MLSSWSTITNEDGKQAKIRKEASYLNTLLAEHHNHLTNFNISWEERKKGERGRNGGREEVVGKDLKRTIGNFGG